MSDVTRSQGGTTDATGDFDGEILPSSDRGAVQADDHLDAPPADESAAHVPLADGGPGRSSRRSDSAVDESMTVGSVLRGAVDFGRVSRSKYGLTPLLVIGFSAFFQRFDTQAFTLAGPEIARDLNISVSDIIGISALVGTFVTFATIGAGYAADRVRRVPFLGIGGIVSGVFSMLTGRGTSFAGIATPRVFDQVADAAGETPAASLLADYYPDEMRGKAYAFLGALANSGGLIAPLVAGYIIHRYGWEMGFVAFGAPLVVMGLLALALLREPIRGFWERKSMGMGDDAAAEEDEPLSFGEGWRATFAVRTVRRATIASAFANGGSIIFSLYFPFFLAERYGLTAFERGVVAIPAVAAGIAGGLVGGSLVDKFTATNPSRVVIVAGVFSLILAPASAAYVLEPALPILILASMFTGFGSSMLGPALSVIFARVIPPTIRTQGIQLTGLAYLPATVLFIPLARNIFRDYDYEGVFLFSVPFSVLGALLFISAAGFYELDVRNAFAQAAAKENYRKEKEAGTTKLLVARNLDVHYGDTQVLFDVDLDIQEGEILALLGTNGAGKSTVLRAICGLTQASGGGIVFDGRDITRMPPNEIAARGVVQMPGGKGIFPNLSVRDNLLLGTWLLDDPTERAALLAEVMEIFPDLVERTDVAAGDLSGGQQQQLSLAQAFLSKPKLLLIDELSLGLAPAVVGQLIEVVKEINRRGVTVVVVEQSVNVALTIADRALFMEKGEVRFDGPADQLLQRPDILRAVYVKGTGALTGTTPATRITAEELTGSRSVLRVDGLAKRYGGITAVSDVSFELKDGEVLGLIGPNGAGKTTVFDLISGHQAPDVGRVWFDGVDITDWSPDHRARKGLIRRFQDARLFPALTVQETLLVSLEQKLEVRSSILGAMGTPQVRRAEKRARARADKLLDVLELGPHRHKYVKELSTGLRRIVDLACVLAAEPSVLMLDEPSSGIAQAEAEGLAPLLRRVKHETGCSIMIIEHDMPLISAVSDELIALDNGALVTRGTPEDVLNDQRVIESYLGTSEAAVNRSGSIQ